jgi:hypothetical protein
MRRWSAIVLAPDAGSKSLGEACPDPGRNQNLFQAFLCPTPNGSDIMADGGNGGIGVLGVLVGALIVAVVGAGVLFATGNLGSKTSTVKLELPKVTTGAK